MALKINQRTYRPDVDHVDPTRDLPKDRQITLKNNIIHIIKGGPFGFYTIHYDKGQIPESLSGEFIGIDDAKKVVRAYLEKLGRLSEAQGL